MAREWARRSRFPAAPAKHSSMRLADKGARLQTFDFTSGWSVSRGNPPSLDFHWYSCDELVAQEGVVGINVCDTVCEGSDVTDTCVPAPRAVLRRRASGSSKKLVIMGLYVWTKQRAVPGPTGGTSIVGDSACRQVDITGRR